MKENKKIINNLFVLIALFVLIIIIGFITINKPELEYKISIEETLDLVVNETDLMRPEKSMAIIDNEHPQFKFIDLRTPYDYSQGHLEGATNIPFKDLLADEYQRFLNQDEYYNLLYADDELQAKEAWLLLKQLGYKNNQVILGGYDYIINYVVDGYKPKSAVYPDEKAAYDYAKIAKETKGVKEASSTKKILPKAIKKRKRVETEVAGGC